MKKNIEQRRTSVQARLEAQLESGVKTDKNSTNKIPLTEQDIKRINKELINLKSK